MLILVFYYATIFLRDKKERGNKPVISVIADDEPLTREILREKLPWKELGFDFVWEAENGQQVLELLSMNPDVDVIISDIRMPHMDGLELVTRIREANQHCQIIFISGYCEKEYLKKAIRLGAVDFLEKPISLPELENSLISAVDKISGASDIFSKQLNHNISTNNYSPPIIAAIQYIHGHYGDSDISIRKIADEAFLSPAYLCSLFKKELTITVNQYIHLYRIHIAEKLLADHKLTLTEIADRLGYGNANYFSKIFKRFAKETPTAYRERINSQSITPVTRDTP